MPGPGPYVYSASPSRSAPAVPIPDGVDLDAMLPSERRAFLQRLQLQGTCSTPATAATSPTSATCPARTSSPPLASHHAAHSVPFTMEAGMHSLPRLSSICDQSVTAAAPPPTVALGTSSYPLESSLPTVILSPPPVRPAAQHHSLPRLLNGFGPTSTSPPAVPSSHFLVMDEDASTQRAFSPAGAGPTAAFQSAGLSADRAGSDGSMHLPMPSGVMSPPTVFDMDLSTSPTSASHRHVPIGSPDHYDNDFFSTPFSPSPAPSTPAVTRPAAAPSSLATAATATPLTATHTLATRSLDDSATPVLTLAECAPTRLATGSDMPSTASTSSESVTLESLSQASGPRITSGLTLPSASTATITTTFNPSPASIPPVPPIPSHASTAPTSPLAPSALPSNAHTASNGIASTSPSASSTPDVTQLTSMFTRSMSLPHASNLPALPSPGTTGTGGTGGLDQYILEAVVGVGAFSKVRLGVHRRSRRPVAIKLVEHKASASQSSNAAMSRHVAQNEAAVFRLVANGCASILQCCDVIEVDDPVHLQQMTALVLEYCPGGDLFDLLAYRHHEVTMHEAARIAWQLCSAVAYLHDRNIAHRDLKLENILLMSRTAPFHIKLSDFGLARILSSADERITSRAGSEEYTAPEVIMLSDSPYAPKPADMWSVGVILYAVLVGQLPFSQESRDVVVVENVAVVPDESTPPVPTQPGPKRASALLRHLESKLALTQPPSRAMSTSPRIPEGEVLADLPPTPTTPTHQMEFTLSAPSSPLSTSPGGASASFKIVRRRSTRKAGRKALWHRIARAEFSFPDEALELPLDSPEPDFAAADTRSDAGSTVESELGAAGAAASDATTPYPLLTLETKAVVRGLLDAKPLCRLTARECCEAVPWIVGGKQ